MLYLYGYPPIELFRLRIAEYLCSYETLEGRILFKNPGRNGFSESEIGYQKI